MEHLLYKLRLHPTHAVLYVAYFLYAFYLSLVTYINSSFLASVVGEELVGALYVVGSALAIMALLSFSTLLRRLGNYRTLVLFATLDIMALLGLATTTIAPFVIVLFVFHFAIFPLILLNLDVFIESTTKNEAKTGGVRSAILSAMSLALIFGLFLSGLLVGDEESYGRVYLLSATLLVPFLGLIAFRFRHFRDPSYQPESILVGLKRALLEQDTRNTFLSYLLLRVFFATSVVYVPLYLHTVIGFSWPVIGLILSFMLLPHILLSVPLGRLADERFGEKEMMIGGFIVLSIALSLISFTASTSIIVWMALLFLLRCGAMAVEVMSETHFFKQVDGGDPQLISGFRMLRMLGYLVGLSIATVLLVFVDLRFVFVTIGIFLLLGLLTASSIRDSR